MLVSFKKSSSVFKFLLLLPLDFNTDIHYNVNNKKAFDLI